MFERMETDNQVYEGETPYKTTKRAYSECVSHGRNKREENRNTFKYHNPLSNHFLCRHIIDYHNNLLHSSPSTEEARDIYTKHGITKVGLTVYYILFLQ